MKENGVNILLGILFILFGFIFIFVPESVFETVVMSAGIVLVIIGGLRFITSLKTNTYLKSYSLVTSILIIVFGIILIIYKASTVKLLASLVGIGFLISGISSLLFMLKANIKDKRLIKSIIKIIIGILSLLIPAIPVVAVGITIGIILIFAGVSILTTKKEDEVVYKVKVKK